MPGGLLSTELARSVSGAIVIPLLELFRDEPLPMKLLLSILWQVASGMAYVSSLQLVHRDIAARNILLTVDFRAKVQIQC